MSDKQEFLEAIAKGDSTRVQSLLNHDPALKSSQDDNGVSALLRAVYYRRADIVKLLFASGLELNVFEAAATGQTERLRAVLKPDPRLALAYSPDGFPPLGLACFFGHLDSAETLMEAGADVNAVSKNKMMVMPLHAAAAGGHLEIARLLLGRGANANAQQEAGFTPLHEAAAQGNLQFAELLLQHGAEINKTTDAGKTPLALAVDKNKGEMAAFLRSHGAQP